MYARFNCRFYKKFISLSFLRKDTCTSIRTNCQQSSRITSTCLTVNLTRNLHSSISSYREVDTTVNMSSECNRKILNIDYNHLLEAQKDDNVLIIDVREQSEIDETGKLPGSIHIPMGDVSTKLQILSEEDFKKLYGKKKPTKDTKIILSCRSGKRSGMVQETIQKLGYENAYNYTGGWMDWESKQKA